jgi:hypothetical protein
MCERHAHTALAEAIGAGDTQRAADLMRSHIVDLLSGLDLRQRPREEPRLSMLLQGAAAEQTGETISPPSGSPDPGFRDDPFIW